MAEENQNENQDRMSYSKEEGIDQQNRDLKRWRTILNDDAYSKLEEQCRVSNSIVEPGEMSGYEILRGEAILSFLNHLSENVM